MRKGHIKEHVALHSRIGGLKNNYQSNSAKDRLIRNLIEGLGIALWQRDSFIMQRDSDWNFLTKALQKQCDDEVEKILLGGRSDETANAAMQSDNKK